MAKTEIRRQKTAEAQALESVARLHRKVSCGVSQVSRQLSNVVDEFFRPGNGAAFTARFGSFIKPASKAVFGPAIYLASAGG
jgi:hypothetical protein